MDQIALPPLLINIRILPPTRDQLKPGFDATEFAPPPRAGPLAGRTAAPRFLMLGQPFSAKNAVGIAVAFCGVVRAPAPPFPPLAQPLIVEFRIVCAKAYLHKNRA